MDATLPGVRVGCKLAMLTTPFVLTRGKLLRAVPPAGGPPCRGPPRAGRAAIGTILSPLVVSRYAVDPAESKAIVRPEMLTRVFPACVDSGPSSAKARPIIAPVVALTISTVGAAVTAAVALVRTGCTKRAKLLALTATAAETGRWVTVTVGPDTGVRAAFSTVPFTR